jgi:hypothetical protein
MWNGAPFSSSSTFPQNPLSLDGTGSFSGLSIPSNTAIAPAGSQWAVTVCPAATVQTCFTKLLTISGTTQSISSQIVPPSVVVNLTVPLLGARAYTDAEITGAAAGTSYLNVTDNTLHLCIQSGFPPCTWHSIVSSTALIFAENYPNVQAAMNACPTNGCTVIASSPAVNMTLGSLDPGAKTITLILGPYTYSLLQLTLRTGLHVIGASSSPGVGGTPPATILQSSSTTTPMVVLGGTTAVLGVDISAMRFYCGAGNTNQIGLDIVAQLGGGLWYSYFRDIFLGGDGVHECAGNPAVFDGNIGGSTGNGLNQFVHFVDVRSFRATNGGPFLITGLNGQFSFEGAMEIDGPTPRDNNTVNLVINDGTETFRPPYSFTFNNLTSQLAWGASGRCIELAGVEGVSFVGTHLENCNGGFQLVKGTTYGNFGVVIEATSADTNTGIDGGSGYIVSMDGNSQVDWGPGNTVASTPDTFFAGTTTYLTHTGTLNSQTGAPYALPSAVSRVSFPVGWDCNSGSFKCAIVTTSGITAGARLSVTITWPTGAGTVPFPDNNYVPHCDVVDFVTAGTSQGATFERFSNVTATSIVATVFNPTGGTLTPNLVCTAHHT